MTDAAAARHLVTAAAHWAAVAEIHADAAAGDSLDALGACLASADALSRARADLEEALRHADGSSPAPEESEARAFLQRVEGSLGDLETSFAGRCDRVITALRAAGDEESLVEARELAARHLEGLARGASLADLYESLTAHGCSCDRE
jgi:hypothetical protein